MVPVQWTSARHSLEVARKARNPVKLTCTEVDEAVLKGALVAWVLIAYTRPDFTAVYIDLYTPKTLVVHVPPREWDRAT